MKKIKVRLDYMFDYNCILWDIFQHWYQPFIECLATEYFFGSGPLTDIAVWTDGKYVNLSGYILQYVQS